MQLCDVFVWDVFACVKRERGEDSGRQKERGRYKDRERRTDRKRMCGKEIERKRIKRQKERSSE